VRRIIYALGTFASLLLPITAAASARPDATVADGRLDAADRQRIETLEQAVRADPENLHVAAEYRQFMIACGEFDRATRLFETLTKRSSGPNAHISLALSYVDKVPVSGDLRRLYLARDAMRALTRAIEQHPTPLAYYIRGQINLFFNNKIFHRAHLGVEDLQKALALMPDETPPALVQRVWVTLGDGHWRADNPVKARETWAAAATRFPANADLQVRLTGDERQVAFAVRHALDDNIRVDTSLRGLVPTP
jgi:tetratricopeptide (TPR) repeat protein